MVGIMANAIPWYTIVQTRHWYSMEIRSRTLRNSARSSAALPVCERFRSRRPKNTASLSFQVIAGPANNCVPQLSTSGLQNRPAHPATRPAKSRAPARSVRRGAGGRQVRCYDCRPGQTAGAALVYNCKQTAARHAGVLRCRSPYYAGQPSRSESRNGAAATSSEKTQRSDVGRRRRGSTAIFMSVGDFAVG